MKLRSDLVVECYGSVSVIYSTRGLPLANPVISTRLTLLLNTTPPHANHTPVPTPNTTTTTTLNLWHILSDPNQDLNQHRQAISARIRELESNTTQLKTTQNDLEAYQRDARKNLQELQNSIRRDIRAAFQENITRPPPNHVSPPHSFPSIPTITSSSSWAAITSQHLPHTPSTTSSIPQHHSITLKITDPQERQEFNKQDNQTILSELRATGKVTGVTGIIKLQSGDISIRTSSESAKDTMERNTNWMNFFPPSTTLNPKLYPVLVHGVPRDTLDLADQETLIKKILEINSATFAPRKPKIARIRWQKKEQFYQTNNKTAGSIIIETTNPQSAELIREKGINLHTGFPLQAEFYSYSYQITQCFQCQRYGHTTKQCPNPARCGHCAQAHNTRECAKQDTPSCPNCRENHPSWHKKCPRRTKQIEKARNARNTLPKTYIQPEAPARTREHFPPLQHSQTTGSTRAQPPHPVTHPLPPKPTAPGQDTEPTKPRLIPRSRSLRNNSDNTSRPNTSQAEPMDTTPSYTQLSPDSLQSEERNHPNHILPTDPIAIDEEL